MNEWDRKLTRLAIDAQQHPQGSYERQRALTMLWNQLLKSGMLCRPYLGQFPGFYEDIEVDARQRLCLFICRNIDQYDPKKGQFLQWSNNFPRIRGFYIEAIREVLPPDSQTQNKIRITIADLENFNFHNDELNPSLSEELWQVLTEDPEGVFRNKFTNNNPAANFQFLAIQRLSGCSWREISEQLGMNLTTLSSFYDRCLVKFTPILKAYLAS